MRPLAVITGILLGSSVAIALSLAVVLFIYWWIGAEQPAMQREIPALRTSTAIFFVLSAVAAAAFYAQLASKGWRWLALGLFAALLVATGVHYWP